MTIGCRAVRRSERQVAEARHLLAMRAHDAVDLCRAQDGAPLAGLAGAKEAFGVLGLLAEAVPPLLLLQHLEGGAANRPLQAVALRAQLQKAIDGGEALVR